METLLRTVLRGAIYPMMRRLPMKVLVALGIVALVLLIAVSGARAATYTTTCPVADGTCLALAERLEVLVAELEVKPETDSEFDYSTVLSAIETNTASGPSGNQEISGTVALAEGTEVGINGLVGLSEPDRDRMDAAWYGVWALVGLTFVLMIAPKFNSLMDVTRGM
jgi:hypothetical protein